MKAIAKIVSLCMLAGTGYAHMISINNTSSHNISNFTVVFEPTDKLFKHSRQTSFQKNIGSGMMVHGVITLKAGRGIIKIVLPTDLANKVKCQPVKIEHIGKPVTVICQN